MHSGGSAGLPTDSASSGGTAEGTGGSGGQFACTLPLVRCGSECVDTSSDANHCGACFATCTGSGPACAKGTCYDSTGDGGSGKPYENEGPPSCNGLPATCGAASNESCCTSPLVTGGTYDRTNDPMYPATVSDFRLDKFEITVGRFRKFAAAYSQNMIRAGAGKNSNDPNDPGWDTDWNASLPVDVAGLSADHLLPSGAFECYAPYRTWTGGNDDRPINCINWYEASAFCIWDGGRLPTEAEWNYAAAGGAEQRVYPWGATEPGADANLAVYGCHYGNCSGFANVSNIAPVGSASAGDGKYGQSDLAGNVWEWTLDWSASPYEQTSCVNCANATTATYRVMRGGDFLGDMGGFYLRTSNRGLNEPAKLDGFIGARCARNAL